MGLAIASKIGVGGSVMAQLARVPQVLSAHTRSAPPHIPLQRFDMTSIGIDSLTRSSCTFAASLIRLVTPCSGVGCALFQGVQFAHTLCYYDFVAKEILTTC